MTFKELHENKQPFILCNVWDVPSTQIAEQLGFEAIGTSSAAIAKMLGKEDGERILFEDLLYVVKLISEASKLPLTVDIESGYGNSINAIVENIKQLVELGVVGINIEDSDLILDERRLCDSSEFADKLSAIKTELNQQGIDIFINVRTDTYLLGIDDALQETLARSAMYQKAGVDGLFVPGIKKEQDIKGVVTSTTLPLNVMCIPDLPDLTCLQNLGVKRISMGNFVHEAMLASLSSMLKLVVKEKSFKNIFL